MENIFSGEDKREKQIHYPEKFINKVMTEYSSFKKLQEALKNGEEIVGRYLDDGRNYKMEAKDISIAIKEGRVEEVKKNAEKALRRNNLYKEWLEIYNKNK